MNKLVVIALSSFLFAITAHAAGPGCEAQAAEKKLSGAAKTRLGLANRIALA